MVDVKFYKEAILIRSVEEALLSLFSKGKISGTIHTCIGQEFSAVAFGNQLSEQDIIFSNHRCHGHYIAFKKDYEKLILELAGKKSGVCGGIGGSQHLSDGNFFSNGIQGGILPVAAGYAFAQKLNKSTSIVVVFIGDGTLGEGIVYETLNIISKWNIPLLIVCENNKYAQSTKLEQNLAGNILKRAEAFDIKTFEAPTTDVENLFISANESIQYVRENCKPAFHLIDTYRLNAHSKGDDDRDKAEINNQRQKDPIEVFSKDNEESYNKLLLEVTTQINKVVDQLDSYEDAELKDYQSMIENSSNSNIIEEWVDLVKIDERMGTLINRFFKEQMRINPKVLFIGEDVHSPYGGAFKIAKGLSQDYPEQVFTTPISEGAIVGISNGLALAGFKPFAEIMFGDFITLAMDQIINHASKFHHMFNGKVTCPIVIRTPMGGGRGYGPTHSQTLDKFLIGIDNVKTIALNSLIHPNHILESVIEEEHPVIVIENKIDYSRTILDNILPNFLFQRTIEKYPLLRITPKAVKPNFTIISYGGTATIIIDALRKLFYNYDLLGEAFFLTQIHPIDKQQLATIIDSVEISKFAFIIEEGSAFAGFGSELTASIVENAKQAVSVKRIASMPIPIPAASKLEQRVLINVNLIIDQILEKL
jgi:2-oxoisovalerate dehydrogenase E1 component